MEGITEIDVIILSYAQNSALRTVTEKCLSSLIASEDPAKIKFNVIVMESEKSLAPFQYKHSTTVYPEEDFGYNRYLNIGLDLTFSKYVCLCNNDLIFHPLWATEILRTFDTYYDLSSASPLCPLHHTHLGFELNSGLYIGYRNRYEIAGWCLFLKRDVFRIMGKLDENYQFWCADNDYANMLSALRLGHVLVSSSLVDHLEGSTINTPNIIKPAALTTAEFFYFEKKWNNRVANDYWKLIS